MMFALLGLAVTLAAFAAATLTASAAVALVWPAGQWAAARAPAAGRARLLLALRLLPAVTGAIAGGALSSAAWLRFEPRHSAEPFRAPLLAAAGAGLALLAVAAVRGLRAWRSGRALARQWTAAGTPVRLPGVSVPAYRIAHAWPVVCVVGTLRPRLFVADTVLDSCTPDELGSVLAHEAGHLAAHDNLKRLVVQFLPDVLGGTRAGRALEKAWETAAETAADARAARARPGGALDLAAALVRVARLAANRRWVELPARALLDGSGVAPRVERLLSDEPGVSGTGRMVLAWALLLVVPVALFLSSGEPSVLEAVHQAAEVLVQAR